MYNAAVLAAPPIFRRGRLKPMLILLVAAS